MTPDVKRRFPALSSRAYEHPSDRAALAALRAVPGFDTVVRRLFGAVGDRALRLAFLASAVRIGPRQLPELHRQYLEACEILSIDPPPELFLAQTPFVNAGAIGVDRPFIVLNSGTLGLLQADEMQFVLGHELGHILSGHALYKTMLRLMLHMSSLAMALPLGGAAVLAVTTALLEWDRCSELSADRAGLLVVQSPELAMRVTMKMAGGDGGLSVDEFVRQAEEYHASGSLVDSVMKLLNLLGRPHPFPVLRLAELKAWVDSGGYNSIVAGEYATRDGDPKRSIYEDLKSASRSYRDAFAASRDPLAEAMREVGNRAQSLGRSVWSALRREGSQTPKAAPQGTPSPRRKRSVRKAAKKVGPRKRPPRSRSTA